MDSASSQFPVSLQQIQHQQQFAERLLEHLAFDSDVFERWRLIGTAQGLATDIEIASFLLQHYESTWDKTQPVVYCVTCHTPLTLSCAKCTSNAVAQQAMAQAVPSETFNAQHPAPLKPSTKKQQKGAKRKASAKSAHSWEGNRENDDDLMGLCIQFSQSGGKRRKDGLQSSKRTSLKSYGCAQCGKLFFKSSDLKKHTRIHTREKPYACQVCPAAFSDPSSFSRHKRVHTGEKPFQCTECESAFAQSSDLTKHRRIHTRDKPLKCQMCDAAFSDPSTFARHRRKHLKLSAK